MTRGSAYRVLLRDSSEIIKKIFCFTTINIVLVVNIPLSLVPRLSHCCLAYFRIRECGRNEMSLINRNTHKSEDERAA
jgi:hypothetical protein